MNETKFVQSWKSIFLELFFIGCFKKFVVLMYHVLIMASANSLSFFFFCKISLKNYLRFEIPVYLMCPQENFFIFSLTLFLPLSISLYYIQTHTHKHTQHICCFMCLYQHMSTFNALHSLRLL